MPARADGKMGGNEGDRGGRVVWGKGRRGRDVTDDKRREECESKLGGKQTCVRGRVGRVVMKLEVGDRSSLCRCMSIKPVVRVAPASNSSRRIERASAGT